MGNSVEDIVEQMRNAPQNVSFSDLHKVCVAYFGEPRRATGSHAKFRLPWQGLPLNIQNDHGKAKRYQVLQALEAIDRVHNGDQGE
jgi:hypothetical protein